MTYTTPEDLSNLTSEQTPSTFDKAKVLYQEGSTRSVRVAKILKAAFSQTAAEFKEGRQSLSPLAQEVTSETVATVKERSQKAAEALNDAWVKEADSPDLSDRISRFLSAIAQTASQSAKTRLFPQVRTQTSKLDVLLKDRYGDRYENIRAKFEIVRSWYATPAQSTTSPHTADSDDEIVAIEVDSEVIR